MEQGKVGQLRKIIWGVIFIITISFGVILGLGLYTFQYANGFSYLTNNSKSCANCHVMEEHFSAWTRSSHRSVATCNDCHTPSNLIKKYLVKASNGFWHSYAFTKGGFHEPIQIKPSNRYITEQACRKCHSAITHAIDVNSKQESISCLHCHRSVGHLH